METFAPHSTLTECCDSLLVRHMTETVVTAVAVLNVIHEVKSVNTWMEKMPVVRMWRGHEVFLCDYAMVLNEARRTGVTDRRYALADKILNKHMEWASSGSYTLEPPRWWGDENLHMAHRSELLRQNPKLYGGVFTETPYDVPMFWPVG